MTTLRSIIVDCTLFSVVKDTSARHILEVMASVLDDEKIFPETQLLDSGYVRIAQRHSGVPTTLDARVLKTYVLHLVNHCNCHIPNPTQKLNLQELCGYED